jgi:ABC-2 type transport system ATP-binding protein
VPTAVPAAQTRRMIDVSSLTKRFGARTAVDDVTFTVPAGRVTAFLGPNGAGKSTTMRVLLGLDHPSSGSARVAGRPYREHPEPLRIVGAHLDGRAVHPGRSGRQHLLALARANGIGARRVDEVLELVGIAAVGRRRAGDYSLGMAQRLGIAGALLGDPAILVLDEPVNGLDTDGVRWIRDLLQSLAREGRTVLISSHLLAEVAQVAAHVLVMARGRLVADCSLESLERGTGAPVEFRTPDDALLPRLLEVLPVTAVVEPGTGDVLRLGGVTAEQVGEASHAVGLRLHRLVEGRSTLEDAYQQLVGADLEYAAGAVAEVV